MDELAVLIFIVSFVLFVGENNLPDGCNLHHRAPCVILYRIILFP